MSRTDNFGLIGGAPTSASPETLATLAGYNRGHTKNPTLKGASDLWAVACAVLADGPIDYAISWHDIAADAAFAARMLDLAAIGRDDFVFFSYIYSQSGHTWPLLKAGFDRGAKMATGMPTQWDAYRLEMYLRRFKAKMVFGVTPEVLDGLEGGGHKLSSVFGAVQTLVATAGAWERLDAAGLKPWKLHWLGPIIAIDPCDGHGARFDHAQWRLNSVDGRLLISNRLRRATTFSQAALPISGTVETIDGEPRLFGLA